MGHIVGSEEDGDIECCLPVIGPNAEDMPAVMEKRPVRRCDGHVD